MRISRGVCVFSFSSRTNALVSALLEAQLKQINTMPTNEGTQTVICYCIFTGNLIYMAWNVRAESKKHTQSSTNSFRRALNSSSCRIIESVEICVAVSTMASGKIRFVCSIRKMNWKIRHKFLGRTGIKWWDVKLLAAKQYTFYSTISSILLKTKSVAVFLRFGMRARERAQVVITLRKCARNWEWEAKKTVVSCTLSLVYSLSIDWCSISRASATFRTICSLVQIVYI